MAVRQGLAVSVVSKVSDPILVASGPTSPRSLAPASEGEGENRALRTGCNFTDFTDLTDLPLLAFLEIIGLFAPDQSCCCGVLIAREQLGLGVNNLPFAVDLPETVGGVGIA